MRRIIEAVFYITAPAALISPMFLSADFLKDHSPTYQATLVVPKDEQDIELTTQVSREAETITGPCPSSLLNRTTSLYTLLDSYTTEFPEAQGARSIEVKKQCNLLTVLIDKIPIKQYATALGTDPVFDKVMQGDKRTPHGEFYVISKDSTANGSTQWYKALHISYPNEADAARGLKQKLISEYQHNAIVKANEACLQPPQNTKLGGEIKIHGEGGISGGNWTWGCMGLENSEIDEVYAFARAGCNKDGTPKTPIHIEY